MRHEMPEVGVANDGHPAIYLDRLELARTQEGVDDLIANLRSVRAKLPSVDPRADDLDHEVIAIVNRVLLGTQIDRSLGVLEQHALREAWRAELGRRWEQLYPDPRLSPPQLRVLELIAVAGVLTVDGAKAAREGRPYQQQRFISLAMAGWAVLEEGADLRKLVLQMAHEEPGT